MMNANIKKGAGGIISGDKMTADCRRAKRSEQSSGQASDLKPMPSTPTTSPVAAKGVPLSSSPTRLVFGLSSKTNKSKHDEYAEQRIRNNHSQVLAEIGKVQNEIVQQVSPVESPTAASRKQAEPQLKRELKPATIRASKYGNFYKPQDLTISKGPLHSVDSIGTTDKLKTLKMPSQSITNLAPATQVSAKTRTKSPQRPEASRRVRKAKSPSTSREASPVKNQLAKEPQVAAMAPEPDKVQNKTSKMQFNIPPPPPINNNLARNSVVSYAKSRIYDKPAKVVLSNPIGRYNGASVLDSNSNLPQSILCGFKPPKQVNVSKAREKWEGGEPFAKCKSRQRLAAQAGKKFLGGTWSMTSVVATQQMQLQQALAQSNSSSKLNNNSISQTEKILTRGSVLERVQQFEKVPVTLKPSSSISSSDSLSDCSSTTSSSSNISSVELDLDSAHDQLRTQNKAISLDAENKLIGDPPSSKQAIYKSKVSSIQNKSSNELLSDHKLKSVSVFHNNDLANPSTNSTRRLSLRRRSSTSSSSHWSTIPKFYHPNGRPNTYEIELQKKNIVACFDKFPDRKALLSGPNYKRHFHSIALACNFSEYFKEPLYLYVKYQMLNSNLLHNSTNLGNGVYPTIAIARKQSGLETRSNGLNATLRDKESVNRKINILSKAASIDNSTMEKIQNQNYISCDQFLVCWKQIISCCFDQGAQFVHLLTRAQRNYLLPDDFIPLIQSIIEDHPGLKFLRAAPDFHMRYIQTVIARIYYHINRSWTGKISLNELRRSNFLAVLEVLSKEEDINQITDYFSYEHFYVIYCKFWNLDQDHDLLISKTDLARHNDAAISSRIIDRIFMGIVSKQIQSTGKMSYSDFVWFLLAEEDKKHPRSIEYWFRLMDIDGDGYISMYEMEYFYYEQQKRLELMNIEALPFLDCACQILDLVNPKEKNKISLSDLKRTKMATIFFDTFINLEKYLEHESREFVSTRDVVQDGTVISDWDRYASEEYENLVTEETSV